MSDAPGEAFRLHVGRGNQSGNGSGGDVTVYDNREEFEAATLKALIEAAAHGTQRYPDRSATSWLRHMLRGGKEVAHHEWTTRRVIAAEQLVDGEWVDLRPVLRLPWVEFRENPEEAM